MLAAVCVLLPAIVIGGQQLTPVLGTWTTDASGVMTHDASKWAAKEGYPLAVFDEPATFTSGTASIEFKMIGGTDDYTAGLSFGHRGASYYYVRYNTKDGNVALWRMDGPKRTVIKHGEHHEQLARNQWHRLELMVQGRRVRAVVNGGALQVEHDLDRPVSGRLGLYTKPDATSAFRHLEVKP